MATTQTSVLHSVNVLVTSGACTLCASVACAPGEFWSNTKPPPIIAVDGSPLAPATPMEVTPQQLRDTASALLALAEAVFDQFPAPQRAETTTADLDGTWSRCERCGGYHHPNLSHLPDNTTFADAAQSNASATDTKPPSNVARRESSRPYHMGRDLTPLERDALSRVKQLSTAAHGASIREVASLINTSSENYLSQLLLRLTASGLLVRRRDGKSFEYWAKEDWPHG